MNSTPWPPLPFPGSRQVGRHKRFAQIDAIHPDKRQSAPVPVPGAFLIANEHDTAAGQTIDDKKLRSNCQVSLERAFRVRRHFGSVDVSNADRFAIADDCVAVNRVAIHGRVGEGRAAAADHHRQQHQWQQLKAHAYRNSIFRRCRPQATQPF